MEDMILRVYKKIDQFTTRGSVTRCQAARDIRETNMIKIQ